MSVRSHAERIVDELHGARIAGDLAAMCRLFASQGQFEIAGATADKPVAIRADGLAAFRPWLGMMVKVFRVRDYERLSLIVEWPNVVAHWRANIHSKVTGATVATELVDLLVIGDGHIVAYREFFVPR
jgi:ketosteroid isomerase-like protein